MSIFLLILKQWRTYSSFTTVKSCSNLDLGAVYRNYNSPCDYFLPNFCLYIYINIFWSQKLLSIFNDYYGLTIKTAFLYNPSSIRPSIKYSPREFLDYSLLCWWTLIFKKSGETFYNIEWRAIDAKMPFYSSAFLLKLGAINAGFRVLLIWELVEYFKAIDTKYLPALCGKWYLLQTKRHSLYNLKLYRVSRIMLINFGSTSSNSEISGLLSIVSSFFSCLLTVISDWYPLNCLRN